MIREFTPLFYQTRNRSVPTRPDASQTLIGGASGVAGNLISGNDSAGVGILGTSSGTTTGNRIEGNRIGTRADGTGSVPNLYGVAIQDASSNHVGGSLLL